jgi:hypothetical protein
LTSQRVVRRRGEVGEEHRHVIADHADRHEEEVVDAGEPDGAAHARLPAQGLDEVVQVSGNRRRQDVGLPLVLFPVDDDREVRLTHVCHRHLTSMLRTEECCQMAGRPGGKIADQGRRPPVPGTMPARLVHPVTGCFRRSGILSGARGHTHADMAASLRKPLAVNWCKLT